MKPEQKAQEMIEYILHKVIVEEDYSTLREYIVRTLKEQDRDTRHACAEEIMTKHSKIFVDTNISYDDLNTIHSDIMNCQGGLE